LSTVPRRLRIAVAIADPARRSRLASLVTRSGHEVVELGGSPDAILSDGAEKNLPAPAVAIGADEREFPGQLPEDATAQQIDAALRAVAAGLIVRAPDARTRTFAALSEEPCPLLTPREVEVLAALSDGLSNKQAARRLGISPHTVKFHVEALFRKLDVGTRAEAVAKGLRRQFFEV
jgi:two-component system, NarL family, nitrate/nitrite response regulator NarL